MPAADLVITGTILTVNPGQPTTEAVAVFGGRIAAADEVVTRGAADPRSVPPESIADLDVRTTYLADRQVHTG